MKKTAICLVLSLLGQALLRAQETSPVIVVSSTGKVKYTSPTTSTPMTVVPGAVLKESGSLQLGSKSAVILYYHGQFKRLEGKGTLAIAPVFADQHALAS